MAYFPNGSAGCILDNQCIQCLHANDRDIACPVWLVHSLFNYDQCSEGQEKLRQCLTYLVTDEGVCKQREAINQNNAIIGLSADDLSPKTLIDDYYAKFGGSWCEARDRVEWVAAQIAEGLEPHE